MHIGQLIRRELTDQGRSVTWFAGQLSCSRTYAYKIFGDESIGTELLLRISELLDVDFFKLYSEEFRKQGTADDGMRVG